MGRGKHQSPMSFWIEVRAASEAKKSDFKHDEEPRYTGYKRNYRKAKYYHTEKGGKLWVERYESVSYCWKDQRGKGRNKRDTQYRPCIA